ncbi:MAG TPA: IPTL-CTERM sorting domain-containing protein [Thermodesulfobacteriota bacterium]|nr:IPTL-CTERM sorting domain-containing protein [Thermodesulfobacteriota bacterium]
MARRQNMFVFAIFTALAFAGILSLGQINARAQLDNNCIISITKAATPANDTEFSFVTTGIQEGTFFLSDPSHTLQVLGINVQQSITVTEDAIPGWTLDGIECTEGVINCGSTSCLTATVDGNSVTFECFDNDTASCTFTNSFTGANIPTLSEWGLISMAVILGIAGIILMRRRRVTA